MSEAADTAVPAAPTSSSNGFAAWCTRARKAIVGFLASGGAAALAEPIARADWSSLTLDNLWQGLIAGVIGGGLVYWVRNEVGPRLTEYGVTPEIEQSIERLINQKLGLVAERENDVY